MVHGIDVAALSEHAHGCDDIIRDILERSVAPVRTLVESQKHDAASREIRSRQIACARNGDDRLMPAANGRNVQRAAGNMLDDLA